MRYLLLIYEEPRATPMAETEWAAMIDEYGAVTTSMQQSGELLGGEALQDISTATTVSVRDGRRVVTDGPFAETKEHLAGYFLIQAPDLDAAIAAAARIPGARTGQVEIRPIRELA
jgi:hypothetical protein